MRSPLGISIVAALALASGRVRSSARTWLRLASRHSVQCR